MEEEERSVLFTSWRPRFTAEHVSLRRPERRMTEGHERQPQIALIHLPTFSSVFTNGLLLSHFVECNAQRPKYIRRSWPMIYSTLRGSHTAG